MKNTFRIKILSTLIVRHIYRHTLFTTSRVDETWIVTSWVWRHIDTSIVSIEKQLTTTTLTSQTTIHTTRDHTLGGIAQTNGDWQRGVISTCCLVSTMLTVSSSACAELSSMVPCRWRLNACKANTIIGPLITLQTVWGVVHVHVHVRHTIQAALDMQRVENDDVT